MIIEISPTEFPGASSLFDDRRQYTPVHAVVNGCFPGRVFTDDIAEPRTAIVWATGRWAYLEGDCGIPRFNSSLRDLIQRIIIPDSLKMKMNWFELYASNSSKQLKELEDCLRNFNSSRHLESVYVWDKSRYRSFRSSYSYPAPLAVEKTNIPILPSHILDAPFVPKKFRTVTAVAFRLKSAGRVVARCRSNGFANGNEFMIDVETFDKNDRGKGYATAAGVALLDHCLDKDLHPLWETTEDNTPSQRLAKKLGFVKDETYPVYAIEF